MNMLLSKFSAPGYLVWSSRRSKREMQAIEYQQISQNTFPVLKESILMTLAEGLPEPTRMPLEETLYPMD